jgi:sugar phosphate isomerase/epimerase
LGLIARRSYGSLAFAAVRLGRPFSQTWDSPDGWIAKLRAEGFRAAYWPLPDDAPDDDVGAYADAAAQADIVIAEIGSWGSNPISPDDAERAAAIEYSKARLALADRVGARCCVNLAGSRGGVWDSPHPDNLTEDTFALIVDTAREIIDAVGPERTFFTLEPMPWIIPDSPDRYLALLEAIDRERFAVHLDPTNMISNPARYFDNAGFLRECFAKLGPHIKCCHAKDVTMSGELPVHIAEVIPGRGTLDYELLLRELDKLDPDTPILVEHLTEDEEYREAAGHVRAVAERLGLAI